MHASDPATGTSVRASTLIRHPSAGAMDPCRSASDQNGSTAQQGRLCHGGGSADRALPAEGCARSRCEEVGHDIVANHTMVTIHRLERRQLIPVPLAEAWDYFATPRNLEEMTPPSLSFRITWGGD